MKSAYELALERLESRGIDRPREDRPHFLDQACAGDPELRAEVDALLDARHALNAHLIVVSNEVGLGLVPPYRLGRVYRDCLGWALYLFSTP